MLTVFCVNCRSIQQLLILNDLRTKIWNELNDTKTNEYYSNLIAKRYQKWDLGTNIFLVLMTSSSIAA